MVSSRGQNFKIHLGAWQKKTQTHSSIHIPAPRPTHNPETRRLPPDPHTPFPDESDLTCTPRHQPTSTHPPDTLTPRHLSHTPKQIHTHQDKMTPRQNRYTHTHTPTSPVYQTSWIPNTCHPAAPAHPVQWLKSCLTLVTPWTVAHQAPLSMGFPSQEYLSGLPFPSLGDLSHPGINPVSPAWQANSLPLSHHRSPPIHPRSS